MFGKLLTNQKIAHKIVKPYVYKALREGLKTHDNGKIQNLRGFGSLSLRGEMPSAADHESYTLLAPVIIFCSINFKLFNVFSVS